MSTLEMFTNAAPANRNIFCAYAALENKEGQAVGTYVQGFYQLAQVGRLRCQMESAGYATVEALKAHNPELYKKLYHANGTLKTPFELAVLKQINKDDIQNAITQEYTWQNSHIDGILPQYVSKKHVGSEWLANLTHPQSKLRMRGEVQGLMITVDNFNPTPADNWTHAFFQGLGLVVTAFTLIGLAVAALPVQFLASLSTASLVISMLAIGVIASFVAKTVTLGNMSNFFSVAETFATETPALLSNQFLKKNSPIAWGKLAQSLGFTVAIGGLSVTAASAVYASTLALPMMTSLGIGAPILAGVLAGVSFIGSCVATSIPVRLLSASGFGIWDNTISQESINQAHLLPLKATKLPPAKVIQDKVEAQSKGLPPNAPSKAERKSAKILDLTEKLEYQANRRAFS